MLYFILGFIAGAVFAVLAFDISTRGTLWLDMADEDTPYLFVEVTRGSMGDILKSKYVVFKVSKRA